MRRDTFYDERVSEEYTEFIAAEALEDMLNRATLIKTFIGDYDSSVKGGVLDLLTVGHRIDSMTEISKILSPKNIDIKHANKILPFNINGESISPIQLIKRYVEFKNFDDAEYAEWLSKSIRLLSAERAVNVPFTPGTDMVVNFKIDDLHEEKREMAIEFIEWKVNKETSNIDTWLHFKEKRKLGDRAKYTINELGVNFGIERVMNLLSSGSVEKELIEMSTTGWVKPIVFKLKSGAKIAIDNKFIYRQSSDSIITIGIWENESLEYFSGSSTYISESLTKRINKSMMLLKEYRKYMSPFILSEANIIEA